MWMSSAECPRDRGHGVGRGIGPGGFGRPSCSADSIARPPHSPSLKFEEGTMSPSSLGDGIWFSAISFEYSIGRVVQADAG